ncbi:WD40-repeat-containing domain protein [Amylostereum chailletii]|nr:WD40-repeat-containing domain protein [Amylostereum chailletii]
MLKGFGHSHADFSSDLRDPQDWNAATLKTLTHCLDAVALAVDPVSNLLAIATVNGVIHILGAPGVETEIKLPNPIPVKFLEFATNIFKLLCIDENDKLYLWDLTHLGQIKLDATCRLDRPVTYVSLSPSHTHAFISLESGQVKTYDLLCKRLSSYTIPNAWELYEQELKSDGMIVDTEGTSRIPVQILHHPRNPSLMFIAYGGGVALIDLKEHKTLRTYELLIPAGAPGGAGYTDPDLLKHRRPSVTSITIHPSGHLFVVGHIDGSIAFWAVEDDSQPLLVRTLDDIDVQIVDGDKLDEYLPGADGPPKHHEPREPIFKLAWSGYPNSTDPRGGETSLIILGGQFGRDPSGVNVLWLPAFNPSEPPTMANSEESLHPHFRKAMRVSLDPSNAHFYPTPGLTQDFVLIPRSMMAICVQSKHTNFLLQSLPP